MNNQNLVIHKLIALYTEEEIKQKIIDERDEEWGTSYYWDERMNAPSPENVAQESTELEKKASKSTEEISDAITDQSKDGSDNRQ